MDLVIASKVYKPVSLKWVYIIKKNQGGEVVKHKTRLVLKV